MLHSIAAQYAEPLFWLFPVTTTLLAAFSFVVFALPLTWIAGRDVAWARPYRLQSRRLRAQQLLGASVRSWAVNNLCLLAGIVALWPVLSLSAIHAGPIPPWYGIVAQLVSFVYLDDFLFYWMHRAMHGQWLYKRIHSWHHRIVTPWAITGNFMHPLEYALTGSCALIGPLLLGSHVVVVWVWFVYRQWEAAEGHCGYEFPWSPTHLLPFNDGAAHHDAHHAKVRGNYAGFLPLWDGVFGTYARGYAEALAARRTARARA